MARRMNTIIELPVLDSHLTWNGLDTTPSMDAFGMTLLNAYMCQRTNTGEAWSDVKNPILYYLESRKNSATSKNAFKNACEAYNFQFNQEEYDMYQRHFMKTMGKVVITYMECRGEDLINDAKNVYLLLNCSKPNSTIPVKPVASKTETDMVVDYLNFRRNKHSTMDSLKMTVELMQKSLGGKV